VPRERRAGSSTRRAAWPSCSSRCSNPTAAAFTTPVAAQPACSCKSVEFIRAHATGNGNGGRARADISIYGQESNYTTWRLAKMNLAIRGIEGQIAHGDTFHNDQFPDLKADFILANPPFNVSDWGGERFRDDKRWKYGVPPAGNANFA
jgi:type I restriction enzyme M protein